MKVAVIGATGMVGQVMLKVLEERSFPLDELIVVASSRSVGQTLSFNSRELTIISLEDALSQKPDLALWIVGLLILLERLYMATYPSSLCQ